MSKILIVDDDEGIRENLELRLKSNKYDVLSASNGLEAVEYVLKEKPDLVLLDVMMPEMDGFQACEQIKKKIAPAFIPVILLTALNHLEEKVKGLKVGADDFISKPFEDQELLARINAFLRIKTLHDKLETSYNELKKLETLKDNLTQLIVHDLKSPVSSIMAIISMFKQKHKDHSSPIADDFIAKIKRNCQIQLDLVDDILELSRMDENKLKLEKRKITVSSLIDECLMQVEMLAAQKNIRLEKSLDENLPVIFCDESYLHRIVVNIISNSLKYTERGGKVRVSVKYDTKESQFVFCVEDTGLGIAKENLNKIFDRFFQVDFESDRSSRRGVGLGLVFCKMAVEAHEGKIWAESEEAKGSSFYFTIPGQ